MLESLANVFGVGIEELIYGEKKVVGLEPEKSDRRKLINIVLATLGSLLTAAGILIILVAIFDEIPEFLLAILCYVPLLIGGAVAAFSYAKKKNSIGWCEGAGVAWVAGLAASYALIIGSHGIYTGDFIVQGIIMAMLTLPMAFMLKSVFPLTAYYVISILFSISSPMSSVWDKTTIAHTIIGIILFLIGLIYVKSTDKNDYRRIYSTWLVVLSASAILLFYGISEVAMIFSTLFGITTALYAADRGEDSRYPFRYLAVPLSSIMFVILTFNTDNWFGDAPYLHTENKLLSPGIAPFLCAIAIAISVYYSRKSFVKNPVKTAYIALSGATYLMGTLCHIFAEFIRGDIHDFISITVTAIALAASLILVASGIKKMKLLLMNFGLIMLCVIIFLILLEGETDAILIGLACVAMGGALLLTNYKLSKSFKAKEAEKNA